MTTRRKSLNSPLSGGSGDVTQAPGYEQQAIKAALYIRVSTDRQVEEGDSLEEQENELRKYCDYRNFRIHKIYIEKGKSGGNTNRPEYQTMLKDIQAKKINTLIVKKIDRLSRSLLDFEELMKTMSTHKVEFISIRESFDTTSAIGTAMVRIILVFAQLEREQTSERLRDVFSYRASQGMYNGGLRPYGYTSINKELVPYAKEKQTIELIAKQFLINKSTSETARFLNENGYRGRNGQLWDKRRIQAILQNPIYTGKVKWIDQIFQGLHQPILSENQFDQIQALFNHATTTQESKTEALLKRLLYCGFCQTPMTPSYTINRHKKKYYYYRCVTTQSAEKKPTLCTYKYVSSSMVNDSVLEAVLGLSEAKHFESFESKINQHNARIDTDLSNLRSEIATLEYELNGIKTKRDHFFDSLISSQFLSSERAAIQTRIAELETEEKHRKSKIAKLHFDIIQKESEKLDALTFKQSLVLFKAEAGLLTPKQLQENLRHLIEEIVYQETYLDIHFKALPWPYKYPLNPDPGK